MTDERVRRRPRRAATGIGQAPWRTLRNPYRPIEIVTADEIETIHRASLRILGEIGVEVLGDRAIDLFRADGADIDDATRRVRLDPDRVEELVALAPPEFELHARNPERNVRLGGDHLVFCAVGGPAFVTDIDRGRRAGNHADFVDYLRLIGSLDIIHQEGGGPLEPTDLPVATRHLDMYHALATNLDKTWHCLGFGATVVDDALAMVAIARGVDREVLIDEPSLITIINTNSPLRLDGPMSDGLMEMAKWGQPVVATPFTLAGAMTPATLAGAIAQQNAEALFCIALSQLVRPGTPMVYGAFTSNVDMRTGSPAFGTPEYVKAAFASGQMATATTTRRPRLEDCIRRQARDQGQQSVPGGSQFDKIISTSRPAGRTDSLARRHESSTAGPQGPQECLPKDGTNDRAPCRLEGGASQAGIRYRTGPQVAGASARPLLHRTPASLAPGGRTPRAEFVLEGHAAEPRQPVDFPEERTMNRSDVDARWTREELINALRLLAAPFADQIAALPSGVAVPDEIALTFDDAFGVVDRSTLPSDALQTMLEIEADLTLMSQRPANDLWQLSGLAEDVSWERLRSKARVALATMGEEYRRPRIE